ncbi:MAG: ferrous iron transport protein A [Selenomonadaceae bacterium]|nr:ferrous iron transport protein A [Selenomonadaceae bacterium]MBR3721526.1 ferrous iron transport protein A [Selenomonadaceae bacterium]
MTLREGKVGETFCVEKIEPSPLKSRLMTMGLTKGTKIEVMPSAPFGDPMAIKIRSYKLALRREDAEKVIVQKVG